MLHRPIETTRLLGMWLVGLRKRWGQRGVTLQLQSDRPLSGQLPYCMTAVNQRVQESTHHAAAPRANSHISAHRSERQRLLLPAVNSITASRNSASSIFIIVVHLFPQPLPERGFFVVRHLGDGIQC